VQLESGWHWGSEQLQRLQLTSQRYSLDPQYLKVVMTPQPVEGVNLLVW
jgi:hypothetical protein